MKPSGLVYGYYYNLKLRLIWAIIMLIYVFTNKTIINWLGSTYGVYRGNVRRIGSCRKWWQ